MVKKIVDFDGDIEYDATKLNNTSRMMMDASLIKSLGWEPKVSLEKGIKDLYDWYKKSKL